MQFLTTIHLPALAMGSQVSIKKTKRPGLQPFIIGNNRHPSRSKQSNQASK
jgi:hypothetical protein